MMFDKLLYWNWIQIEKKLNDSSNYMGVQILVQKVFDFFHVMTYAWKPYFLENNQEIFEITISKVNFFKISVLGLSNQD